MTTTLGQDCVATKRNGESCGNKAIHGATVCRAHGGATRHVRQAAAVRADFMRWGLDAQQVDPGETLLALVSQSAARVAKYAAEVAEFIQEAEDRGIPVRKALVGDVWTTDESGEAQKQGEYLRGLVQLENSERDRCAGFCKTAIAAGLAERTVRLAERQGELLAEVLRRVMRDPALGLSTAQRELVPTLAERYFGEISA
ncbi:MAG: hypothetical protein JWO67_3827 [Streptosporangiaceae bacterium]|nr:hypothetical protein [Streptosporangiaceae bacterium]